MHLSLNALFTFDLQGRMLRVNEPDGDVAPRFFLGRTTAGNMWRFRQDVPADSVEQLEALCRREPIPESISELRQPPMHFEEYVRVLSLHAPAQLHYAGPEYLFPHEIKLLAGVHAKPITLDDIEKLKPHFEWMIPLLESMPPAWAVEQDGVFVSACFSSRTTPAADEAGVYTVEACRGKGYAPACVTAWAASIRALGRVPLYGTSWDNLASQRIANKLGLIMFGGTLQLK